jgi:hypothetical protein
MAPASPPRMKAARSCSSLLPAMTGPSLALNSRRSSVKVAVIASRAAPTASFNHDAISAGNFAGAVATDLAVPG